jgi:hypothetical protein
MAQALKPGALSGAGRRAIPAWGALALTGLGFAAGYLMGQRPAPQPDQRASQTSMARAEPASAELVPRTEAATPSVAAAPARSPEQEGASSPVSADVATDRDGTDAKEARVKTRATRSSRTPDGLAAELALLARAERAIRAGNSDLALALLDQLDRDLPKPQLQQERQAARLLAECERSAHALTSSSAPSAATEHARRYLSRHPASVYSERIRTLCGLDVAASDAPSKAASAATQPAAPNGGEGSALGGH